ncbi:MAG TPA: hypothetical protein ENI27_06565 [bacterium]|nr:hypothetical protein [bacterium]
MSEETETPQKDKSSEFLDAIDTLSYSIQELTEVLQPIMQQFVILIANEASKRGMTTEQLIANTLVRIGKTAFGGRE